MKIVAAQFFLAGTFGLASILAVNLNAQNTAKAQAGSQKVSQQAPSPAAQSTKKPEHSPAYKSGYQDGKSDRDDNFRPRPRDQNWPTKADRLAYDEGYHAGYCADEEKRTGYYNGTYSSSGPPVVRNGYYGYNAPNPECVNKSNRGH